MLDCSSSTVCGYFTLYLCCTAICRPGQKWAIWSTEKSPQNTLWQIMHCSRSLQLYDTHQPWLDYEWKNGIIIISTGSVIRITTVEKIRSQGRMRCDRPFRHFKTFRYKNQNSFAFSHSRSSYLKCHNIYCSSPPICPSTVFISILRNYRFYYVSFSLDSNYFPCTNGRKKKYLEN